VLAVLLLGAPWLSSCGRVQNCACPYLQPDLIVESADGGFAPNVTAFVVSDGGPSEQDGGGADQSPTQLDCESSYDKAFVCTWPATPAAGSYTIQVGAPGFETVDVAVTLTFSKFGGAVDPEYIRLAPGDGGP
jgi:hypothetical protein